MKTRLKGSLLPSVVEMTEKSGRRDDKLFFCHFEEQSDEKSLRLVNNEGTSQ
ncbi:MAG: hypothetical protein V1770_02360 [bacterium]